MKKTVKDTYIDKIEKATMKRAEVIINIQGYLRWTTESPFPGHAETITLYRK